MPRKTGFSGAGADTFQPTSMRPRPDAAENLSIACCCPRSCIVLQ